MTQVATLEAAEAIRGRLERALLHEEVNLASENGRGRAEELIEETLRSYEAEALSGQALALDSRERAGIAAELRNELIGLGAIAERMLADPVAQEWMINGPRRLFRDTGERIERVPDLVFDDDRQVRAFQEDQLGPKDTSGTPVGGEAYNALSLEVRARIVDHLAGAVFYDLGNVALEHEDYLEFEDFRTGIGVGLRYLLPIGPLRLDLGYNPSPRDDEDDFVLHFSVGFPF